MHVHVETPQSLMGRTKRTCSCGECVCVCARVCVSGCERVCCLHTRMHGDAFESDGEDEEDEFAR